MAKILIGATAEELAQEIDGFFMGTDRVWETMTHAARRLEDAGIEYAVIGGMALTLHGFARPTADVDILVSRAGLDRVHLELAGRGFLPSFSGARKSLRDTTTGVKVDFITTGEYPGDGKPKAVVFPDPATTSTDRLGYKVIELPRLIELKLASGLTNPLRLRDLADVQDLISALNLPRNLADNIDSSVRDEYLRMWDAAAAARPQAE
ncbi:MAG: hypothetical protein QOC81_3786 [Thermoanaerobaculia bacterium]|jgi:hypothetical protein|nr:hypothetical protein [Thermoanaerobaculia bacterium]